jgi:DNA mismatch repair protein MutL
MSDIIQLLPDSVANQIAAGEVIQRPASVIKELVENAVDAGARNIHVTVTDAGRTNIQVIDDGKGMSETDARLAFERHSTSKIRKADDLFALRTMGFRGEALASIAAVAQVELKSRQATDEIGTLIQISGSRYEKQEPCSCAVGSIFSVSNIFYNVPARRKFLKSNSTELNNILTAFERIALVNPQITFTLHSNGTEVFNLRAANLRQRILDVFGKRFNQELLPVNVETTMCKVSGFVGKPESARKKGVHQFFFVNGRYMKHPYFNKAVMAAYDRLVPQGEQVPYFLYFDVDPKDIDVNIHPTKTEIKFENEQAIWQILSASVKVGKFHAAFNVASGDITAAAINVIGTHLVIADKSATVNSKMVANLETVAKAESVADVTLTDADFGDIAKGQLAYGYTAEVKEGVLVLTSAPVKAEADAESDAADLATLLTLANRARAFAANISVYKGDAGKAQDVVKKAIALADKLAKKEGGENAKEQAKAFRNVQTNLVAINKTIPVLGLKASALALDFVGANLKAYGTK